MAKKAGWVVGAVVVLPLLLGGVALGLGKLLPGYGLAAVNTPASLPDQLVAEALFPGGIQLRGLRSETVAVREITDTSNVVSYDQLIQVEAVLMAEKPITLAQYDVFTKATQRAPLSPELNDRSRFAEVSDWTELQAFLAWLSASTKQQFRLPTNAEWQLAMGLRKREQCRFEALNDATPECKSFDKNETAQLGSTSDWEWTSDCIAEAPQGDTAKSEQGACNRHLLRGGTSGICWLYTQCQFLTLPSNSIKAGIRVVLEQPAL